MVYEFIKEKTDIDINFDTGEGEMYFELLGSKYVVENPTDILVNRLVEQLKTIKDKTEKLEETVEKITLIMEDRQYIY